MREKFILGIQHAFSPDLQIRASGERYRVDDAVGKLGGVTVLSARRALSSGRDTRQTRPDPNRSSLRWNLLVESQP
ncbi:hypothetical protein LNV09_17800 [Paucibacter sp. B2R-40]|uniref:hypothetical protein n=1 Tax=Paucibacter sp. B2R-40 TaxID=2893554 RepID=UPI0021E47095|nr:hypothetical protein [Paucibacter sp. B2R-40]MCV2355998.1 hypothetical protein [Paucibacter sp. B2R-40]